MDLETEITDHLYYMSDFLERYYRFGGDMDEINEKIENLKDYQKGILLQAFSTIKHYLYDI